jgi:hypothetical protein
MRTFLFSLALAAALMTLAVTAQPANASWLSEALHAYLDRDQVNYPPAYNYPAPPATYVPPSPAVPAYGYYSVPTPVPYPAYGPSYYGSWYVYPYRGPAWRQHWEHEWREHHR